jgi:hypothetical protein
MYLNVYFCEATKGKQLKHYQWHLQTTEITKNWPKYALAFTALVTQ